MGMRVCEEHKIDYSARPRLRCTHDVHYKLLRSGLVEGGAGWGGVEPDMALADVKLWTRESRTENGDWNHSERIGLEEEGSVHCS